jgi:Spy/CpxP family protein refolding chaperone
MQSSYRALKLLASSLCFAALCSVSLPVNTVLAQSTEPTSIEPAEAASDSPDQRRPRRRMLRERARSNGTMAGRGMKGGFGGGPLDLSELNLSEEQKSRILAHRQKTKGKAKEVMQALKGKRLEFKEMMFDPEISAAQIRTKRSEMRSLQDEAEAIKLDDFLSIRTVLTAEQLKKLKPERGIAVRARAREGN